MWIRKYSGRLLAVACGLAALLLTACGGGGHRDVSFAEQDALISIYKQTDGDHWYNNANWLCESDDDYTCGRKFNPPECDWYGVICDQARQHVVGIDLHGNNLNGQLPLLPDLTELKSVDVRGNPKLDVSLWTSGGAPSSVTFLH